MARYSPGSPILREHLTNSAMVNGNEAHISRVEIEGRVKEWVGIGWIDVTDGVTPQGRAAIAKAGSQRPPP